MDTIVDGSKRAKIQLLLAHGAGAAMDTEFMTTIAQGIAAKGVRVIRFEFPYMAKKRKTGKQQPPDRAPILEECYRKVIAAHPHPRLFIGGKSLGGRMAVTVAPGAPVSGVLCLGYPFHPPGKPQTLRLEVLAKLEQLPALIIQGTRDPFGTKAEVAKYKLGRNIKVRWLEDGEHGFVPRKSSGRTEEQNLQQAVDFALEFLAVGR